MRKPCLQCVIKHCSQAQITYTESRMGYPSHVYLTIGHLGEASEEALGASEELAKELRQYRMMLQEDHSTEIPFLEICERVQKIIDEDGCGDCQESSKAFRKALKKKKKNDS